MKKQAVEIWAKYLKKRWPVYLTGLFAVLVTNFMQVLLIRNLGWILDFFNSQTAPFFLQSRSGEDVFVTLFFILAGSSVVLLLGRVGWRLSLARETHKAAAQLKSRIWDNVRFFKREDLNADYTKGILMNITTSDVNSARAVFGFTLVAALDVVFLGAITVLTMVFIHAPLALSSLGVLLVVPHMMKKISDREIFRYEKAQEYLGFFNDLGSRAIATVRLQRLTQTGGFWKRDLTEAAWKYRRKKMDAVDTSLLDRPSIGLANIISYVVLFTLGINFFFRGVVSLGDFVAMQGLVFILQDVSIEFAFVVSEFKEGRASLSRIADVYNRDKESFLYQNAGGVPKKDEVLKTENLSFQYRGSDSPVFRGINLTIKRGDRLGIAGPVGCGKSTLLNILCGLERKFEGTVTFSGRGFDQYAHRDLRRHIGFTRQKPFLFAKTIRENVQVNRQFSDDQVWRYLELAGLDRDVGEFPDKLDTSLGEGGINLSGGQKQRLTLARTLARNPDILFLDDCLSSVDTVTEESILSNLNDELRGKTIVWVAHRPSTLKYCHRVLKL